MRCAFLCAFLGLSSGAGWAQAPELSASRIMPLMGKPAPDFKLPDLSGKEVQLSSYRGKVVLLNFWATSCEPCSEILPALQKLHMDNPELVMLGIDVGEDLKTVQQFVTKYNITYPILLAKRDQMGEEYSASSFPNLTSFPTVTLIDRVGAIRDRKTWYGPEIEAQLRAAVRDALNPSQGVLRIGGAVTGPALISKVEPFYSKEARKARLEGTVVLALVVTSEGLPRDIHVLRSVGSGLDESAIAAVSEWRFRPGHRDGQPVNVQVTVEVNFRLKRDPENTPAP